MYLVQTALWVNISRVKVEMNPVHQSIKMVSTVSDAAKATGYANHHGAFRRTLSRKQCVFVQAL